VHKLTALNQALAASAVSVGRTDAILIGFQQTFAVVASGLGLGIFLIATLAAINRLRKSD
jgi:hypothetical protein